MEQISTVLYKVFKGTPQHEEWMVACLQGAWSGLVGQNLAAVCRPQSFSGGRLTIEVLDADWEGALRSMERDILEKVQTATAHEVTRISIAAKGVGLSPAAMKGS